VAMCVLDPGPIAQIVSVRSPTSSPSLTRPA
jgi:hypothetical protein